MNEETIAHHRSLMPQYLYRFRAGNANDLDALVQRKIWVSSFDKLNDPHDGNLTISSDLACKYHNAAFPAVVRDEFGDIVTVPLILHAQAKTDADVAESYRRRAELLQRQLRSSGVSCFSERFNEHLMWAHYADGHKGFCIEYPVTLEGFDTFSGKYSATAVVYVDEYPQIDIWHLSQVPMHVIGWYLFCHKYKQYEYEREWRVAWPESNKLMDFDIPPTSIIFGVNASDRLINDVRNIYKEDGSVKFKKMNLKKGSFNLEVSSLE